MERKYSYHQSQNSMTTSDISVALFGDAENACDMTRILSQ